MNELELLKGYRLAVIPSESPERYEPYHRYLLVPKHLDDAATNDLVAEARRTVRRQVGPEWSETDLWTELERRGCIAPEYFKVAECWDDSSEDELDGEES